MPEEVQRRRTAGWSLPDNTVIVDRTTKLWGNPYKVGEVNGDYQAARDRAHAVELYEQLAAASPTFVQLVREELRGKNLACTCPVDGLPCHRQTLLRIANSDGPWPPAVNAAPIGQRHREPEPGSVIAAVLTVTPSRNGSVLTEAYWYEQQEDEYDTDVYEQHEHVVWGDAAPVAARQIAAAFRWLADAQGADGSITGFGLRQLADEIESPKEVDDAHI